MTALPSLAGLHLTAYLHGRIAPHKRLHCLVAMQVLVDTMQFEPVDAQQAAELLNAALQPLTQLTSLLVHNMPAHGGFLALSGLSRLQQACFTKCYGLGSLPSGPWCSGLQVLGASWNCLQQSGAFRAAAEQLQQLVVLGSAERATSELLLWAGRHTALQRLQLELHGRLPAELLGPLLRLSQRRLQLEVTPVTPTRRLRLLPSISLSRFEKTFTVDMDC